MDNPDNYRGITLLSCLGKLFTSLINNRLNIYLEETNLLGIEQAGFRDGFSTLDHIFTLHCLIDLYLHKKKRIYCCFIDYKKAFDLVDRSSLWMKLLGLGINGRIFNVVHNLYDNAKSCVKINKAYSNIFTCNIGVRQGDNLSPLLFAIYLNDFESYIASQFKGLSNIDDLFDNPDGLRTYINLYVLLYADDTVVLADSSCELQKALNAVRNYCDEWHLTVNTDKTKVMIFSRGKVKKCPVFSFGNCQLEVTYDYTYLGIKFNYNGKFDKAIDKQVSQARRAMYSLITKARRLQLPVDIQCELFEQLIVPILLYGSEVWGYCKLDRIEIFYRKFLKQILHLRT
jgi:hypothetical protein